MPGSFSERTSAFWSQHKRAAVLIALIAAFLAYVTSEGWLDIDTTVQLLFIAIMLVGGWHSLQESQKRNSEINRAFDERLEKEQKRKEELRAYEEQYHREVKALKKRVLDDLKAIARGEKSRLAPEAIEAARELQVRHGEHPETLAAWAPVIDNLSSPITDPKQVQAALEELLYPETLEDVEELQKQVNGAREKIALGEQLGPDSEDLYAAFALEKIRARDVRRRHEERKAEQEAEALERRKWKEFEKENNARLEALGKASERNFLRLYGLHDLAPEK